MDIALGVLAIALIPYALVESVQMAGRAASMARRAARLEAERQRLALDLLARVRSA